MVRRSFVLGILFITLLSLGLASAAGLRVDGGTLQAFQYTAEVPVSAGKDRSTQDGSQLEVIAHGFDCTDEGSVFVEVRNAGKAMQGPSTWVLLMDKTIKAQGELSAMASQEEIRLQHPISKPGLYTYKVVQQVGITGAAEVFSVDIAVSADQCAQPTPPATTPTVDPTLDPTVEPSPSPAPIVWDQSSLEFNTQGFTCDKGGIVWAVIQNKGEPMSGPVIWELYLDKTTLISAGEVPVVGTMEFYTIESQPPAAGRYSFRFFQRPGHPDQGELWSGAVDYDPQSCAAPVIQPLPTDLPTAVVPPVIEPVIEPSPIPDATDIPEAVPTAEPPTPEPPTPEPPTPEPPTPEPPTPEPPTPEPLILEPTDVVDTAPTDLPAP